MEKSKITEDWALYEAGKQLNQRIICPNDISYYDMIDAVIAFFGGNQWRNVEAEDIPKPVFNYIKRALTFFVASLTSTNTTISLEPLEYKEGEEEDETIVIANAEIKNILEKMKFEVRIKDMLFKSGITGESYMHFFYDKEAKYFGGTGVIKHEIVSGSNVMFGNANNDCVEEQPYIIITGRDMVTNLQKEAKMYNEPEGLISEDIDYLYMPGDNGKIEVEADKYGKALYIYIYRKNENGKVTVSKSVQNAYIYKDIELDLDYYPISKLIWEREENNYHGKGVVIDMIPNQIAINKMFAMVIYHLMMTAFPTAVYNEDKIMAWTNEIGASIGIKDMAPGESIRNMAGYLEPASMSVQITNVIEMAIRYTKECMGITDASLGAIDPKNTSAIIAVQKSAVVPLENVKSNMYEFIEDTGRILLDMISTYYGTRKVLVTDGKNRTVQDFDFGTLKGKWLNIKADVGSSTYYSEIASTQTLDNLLTAEKITFLQYLKRIPRDMIPNIDELIKEVEEQLGMMSMDETMNKQANYEQMAQYVETLPEEIQAELKKLTDAEFEKTVAEMMAKDPDLQPQAQGQAMANNNLNQAISQIV